MSVNYDECDIAGIDYKEVEKVVRKFNAAAKAADKLGITLFGGSGSGTLRFRDDKSLENPSLGGLIIANLKYPLLYDGGDGGCITDDDGLERGE